MQEKSALSHSAPLHSDGTDGKTGELHLTCEEFYKFILHVVGTPGTV